MPSTMKSLLTLIFLASAYALPTPQLAGEGALLNSVASDTDNGVGYGVKNAEDNTANLISSLESSPPPRARRQLDKISAGLQDVSNSAGTGGSTKTTTNGLDNLDGALTSGAANTGAAAGSAEESTLEAAGGTIPRL